MAILADSKILEGMDKGEIIIQPFSRKQLGSNSYDVLLDNTLITYDSDVLDCKKDHSTTRMIIPEEGIVLQPGTLYLGSIVEYTETLNNVILFEGKSSLARLGLFVHITSGFGDVGYKGYLTVELSCVQPIRIYKHMKIGQIYYQTVEGLVIQTYDKKADAKYNNKTPLPMKSFMFQNFAKQKEDFINRMRDSGISFDPNKLDEDDVQSN